MAMWTETLSERKQLPTAGLLAIISMSVLIMSTACSSGNAPTDQSRADQPFLCVRAVAPKCEPEQQSAQWCKLLEENTSLSRDGSCRGVQWSFPETLKPIVPRRQGASAEEITLLNFPPVLGAQEDSATEAISSLYTQVSIQRLTRGAFDFDVKQIRTAWNLKRQVSHFDGYDGFAGSSEAQSKILLVPRGSEGYILLCDSADEQGATLVGACEVSVKYLEVMKLTYFVPASQLSQVPKANQALAEKLDAYRAKLKQRNAE